MSALHVDQGNRVPVESKARDTRVYLLYLFVDPLIWQPTDAASFLPKFGAVDERRCGVPRIGYTSLRRVKLTGRLDSCHRER